MNIMSLRNMNISVSMDLRQMSNQAMGRPKERIFTAAARDDLCQKLGISKNQISISVAEIRQWRKALPKEHSVGFVPTMGALHSGHYSLMIRAVKENNVTAASIFVNPAQFAPHEDYLRYPWQPEKDIEAMVANGVKQVFIPSLNEMYPDATYGMTSTEVVGIQVVPKGLDFLSEGKARPGFFTGVATVVSKLFNLVQPTNAYFGQKDGLQVMTVRRLVRDLNFPLTIVPCETQRESDGLAKSSRNVYLSKTQREIAPQFYKGLSAVRDAYNSGERSYNNLLKAGVSHLESASKSSTAEDAKFKVEYLSICNALTGEEFDAKEKVPEKDIMVSAAIRFHNCRLIDNILIGRQS